MNILDQDNIALYPDQAMAALNRLEALLPEARVDQALRLVPGKRAIFLGRMGGRDVVFRLPLDEQNRAAAATEWAELTRAHNHMQSAPNLVAEPIRFDPDTGVSVISHVPGEPLLGHLWSLDADGRGPLIARAADWLWAYMSPTIVSRKINRRPWRRWAGEAAEKQPHAELAEIERRILQKMNRLSRELQVEEWRAAIPHGDFHLNNLILSPDGATLTGIDTGGSNHAPIYKDIARALTHMARRGMVPSGRRRFGVDADAYAAFSTRFALSDVEENALLPFMIAFETLIKVEHPKMSRARIEHALDMSHALFQDLRQIT